MSNTPTFENKEVDVLLDSLRKNINASKKETRIDMNWTDEYEEEIIRLSKLCKTDAADLYKRGSKMTRYGKYINISTIICSALTIYISTTSVESAIKDNLVTAFSACSLIIKGIYQVYNFSENGGILKEVSRGLENLSINLRCEAYKPIETRKNFNQLVYDAQLERDQLLLKADKAE
jgi:hypothetical protein